MKKYLIFVVLSFYLLCLLHDLKYASLFLIIFLTFKKVVDPYLRKSVNKQSYLISIITLILVYLFSTLKSLV